LLAVRQSIEAAARKAGQSFKDFWQGEGKLRAAKEQVRSTDCSPEQDQGSKDRMWRR